MIAIRITWIDNGNGTLEEQLHHQRVPYRSGTFGESLKRAGLIVRNVDISSTDVDSSPTGTTELYLRVRRSTGYLGAFGGQHAS
jgi:hypothetical protein